MNHLQTIFAGNNVAVLCIYCNFKEQSEQTVSNLVASLLKQLIEDSPEVHDNIKSLYERHKDQRARPTLGEFQQVLISEIKMISKVFIVVDALDECSEADGTRAKLLSVLQSLGFTHLLATARPLSSILEDFQGIPKLEIHANDHDVQRYIEERIPHEPWLDKHVKGHPLLQEEIIKKIIQNVKGM